MKKSILSIGLFVACNPQMQETTSEQTTDSTMYLCVPGESIECGCENGLSGAQTCQGDGQSFGDCVCEEPETTGDISTGDMSTTGSGQECTPGEIDACACDTESVGTSICTDGFEWGECFCKEPETPDYPGYQWVLRNKDGDIVDAVFEPMCIGDKYESCTHEPAEQNYPCIFVKYLNGNPLWLRYDVETGESITCYDKYFSLQFEAYDDISCIKNPLVNNPQGLLPGGGGIIRSENKLLWADFKQIPSFYTQVYHFENGQCVPWDVEEYFYKITEVPLNIQTLFSNAPYVITLE